MLNIFLAPPPNGTVYLLSFSASRLDKIIGPVVRHHFFGRRCFNFL